MTVGRGLSESAAVDFIVERAPDLIAWLEELGLRFDQSDNKHELLTLEAGHSYPRVLSSGGDATGKALQACLSGALERHDSIDQRQDLRAVDLLKSEGRCIGVVATDGHGSLLQILAGATVLASGAAGQIYRETTNPAVATGDGLAMAYRAGAALQDLEFVQFHPTTLYIAGAARVLISEAVRGAGAILIDRDGRRVMEGEHPDLDLAPRDVVSRAILRRMVETGDTHVYLDTKRIKGKAKERFPQIAGMCEAFGIQIDKEAIPVRPGAHYMIGGVRSDLRAGSDLPGLFVCGEVASTGLHGANRLASNSLLEALVMGRVAGELSADTSYVAGFRRLHDLDENPEPTPGQIANGDVMLNLDDMLYSLKSLMWRQVGLIREAFPLGDAMSKIAFWESVLRRRPKSTQAYVDLANMLCVSRLVAASALFREESRGTHFRSDFPKINDQAWRKHTLCRRPAS